MSETAAALAVWYRAEQVKKVEKLLRLGGLSEAAYYAEQVYKGKSKIYCKKCGYHVYVVNNVAPGELCIYVSSGKCLKCEGHTFVFREGFGRFKKGDEVSIG